MNAVPAVFSSHEEKTHHPHGSLDTPEDVPGFYSTCRWADSSQIKRKMIHVCHPKVRPEWKNDSECRNEGEAEV